MVFTFFFKLELSYFSIRFVSFIVTSTSFRKMARFLTGVRAGQSLLFLVLFLSMIDVAASMEIVGSGEQKRISF